ncbi:hypothetical protein [Rhizobium halophytocola]|uniref:Outer membrane protein beta-barrel domain-containing protein n=1 Tax=Rhizobium halophytocola TaxID=735519 RepID=A0ABS4E1K5_9HYPH|nr:hypothetical protein [Rhizobium halophytocola]MBP1851791.1 hypothetical protein [Rhizobium halophytocola]
MKLADLSLAHALLPLAFATPSLCADTGRPGENHAYAIFGFAGAMTDADMGSTATIFGPDYEDHAVIGGGAQYFPYAIGNVKLGLEAGLAARMGDGLTGEIWGGVVARYDKIRLADHLFLSPAFTFGISHVSDAHAGREAREEAADGGDAATLFYLGPELNLSFSQDSSTEVFWRLQHRSGAWGTLGDMHGAANANVFGIRYKF